MSLIFAIDPGCDHSAWLELVDGRPASFAHEPNDAVLERIRETSARWIAVEMVASYGMPVGREVFETCVWAGRFMQAWLDRRAPGWGVQDESSVLAIYRKDVKLHLCGSSRAKDANVRQALLDRYGPGRAAAIGLKRSPGPLYGVSGHAWAALAVAVTAADVGVKGAVAEPLPLAGA